jgi:hypothetical protein
MAYERAPRSSFQSAPASQGMAQISPRPFATQERPDAETAAFQQRKRETAGLEDRERSGASTPEDRERLSALRTEMQDFWTGRIDRAARFGHNVAALPPPVQTASPVIQARWIKVEGSGDPGQYYWEGRGDPDGDPPNGGARVDAPPLGQMEDTHSGRSGGSMKSLRTDADHDEADLGLLAHFGSQAASGKGVFYPGPVETRGLGPTPVQSSVPHRDPGEHRTTFSHMTGGISSSTQYQQQLGTAEPGTSYQILHGMGHGEGGKQTQSASNLASASEGANTEMIPFDKAISGNPDVIVDTSFDMRPGTQRAERIRQKFSHKYHPYMPFHDRVIDGDRPRPTRSEYEGWEKEASSYKDPKELGGLVTLAGWRQQRQQKMKQVRKQKQEQSVWGRLGQWAPGSHPLDQRGPGRDDDDAPTT